MCHQKILGSSALLLCKKNGVYDLKAQKPLRFTMVSKGGLFFVCFLGCFHTGALWWMHKVIEIKLIDPSISFTINSYYTPEFANMVGWKIT